jgi:hypothetical protein
MTNSDNAGNAPRRDCQKRQSTFLETKPARCVRREHGKARNGSSSLRTSLLGLFSFPQKAAMSEAVPSLPLTALCSWGIDYSDGGVCREWSHARRS